MFTTTRRRRHQTVEIPAETMAQLMSNIGGHAQPEPRKYCSYETELKATQELPAIAEAV